MALWLNHIIQKPCGPRVVQRTQNLKLPGEREGHIKFGGGCMYIGMSWSGPNQLNIINSSWWLGNEFKYSLCRRSLLAQQQLLKLTHYHFADQLQNLSFKVGGYPTQRI